MTDRFPYTEHELDTENMTHNAMYRQYSPAQGRWLSPDPYAGSYDLTNPQSLNRYAYALNSPMTTVDTLGLDGCVVNGVSASCTATLTYGAGGGLSYSGGSSALDAFKDFWNDLSDFFGWGDRQPILTVESGSGVAGSPNYKALMAFRYNGVGANAAAEDANNSEANSNNAPNNGNTKNACIASALGSGALSIGIDALGFIPGEKDVEAGVKIGAGTVARQIGNWKGYRGIVADQFGARIIASQSQNVSAAATGYGIGNGAGTGDWLGAGLSAAGLIPGLNEVAAIASIGYDAYKTAKAVANCH